MRRKAGTGYGSPKRVGLRVGAGGTPSGKAEKPLKIYSSEINTLRLRLKVPNTLSW